MAVSILLCVPKLEEQLTTEQFQGCDVDWENSAYF